MIIDDRSELAALIKVRWSLTAGRSVPAPSVNEAGHNLLHAPVPAHTAPPKHTPQFGVRDAPQLSTTAPDPQTRLLAAHNAASVKGTHALVGPLGPELDGPDAPDGPDGPELLVGPVGPLGFALNDSNVTQFIHATSTQTIHGAGEEPHKRIEDAYLISGHFENILLSCRASLGPLLARTPGCD